MKLKAPAPAREAVPQPSERGATVEPTREERIQAIRDAAVAVWGKRWEDPPRPRDAEWRDPHFLVRVPRYRYSPLGAALGVVRLASYCVPLLGGEFRKMEDRIMYSVDRKKPRSGGAWDTESGPNVALFRQWHKRMDLVADAIAAVDAEYIHAAAGTEPRARTGDVEKALDPRLTQALESAVQVTSSAARLFHDVATAGTQTRTQSRDGSEKAVLHDPAVPANYNWHLENPARPQADDNNLLVPSNQEALQPVTQSLANIQALLQQLLVQPADPQPAGRAPAAVPVAAAPAPERAPAGNFWENLETMPEPATPN